MLEIFLIDPEEIEDEEVINGTCDKEHIYAVFDEDDIIARGMLYRDGTWEEPQKINEGERGISYLRSAIIVEKNVTADKHIEAQAMLLNALLDQVDEYNNEYTDRDIVLRCFSREENSAEQEFYSEFGLKAKGLMRAMAVDLEEKPKAVCGDMGYNVEKYDFDMEGTESYLDATRVAFGVAESLEELRYRLRYQKASVFVVREKNEILASVSVWKIGDTVKYATENIFTIPSARGRGLAEKVIQKAFEYIVSEGGKEAWLNCSEDNLIALRLYEKLGYRHMYSLVEMCYK